VLLKGDAPIFGGRITKNCLLIKGKYGIHTNRVATESYRWVRHVTWTVSTSHANRAFVSSRKDRLRGWKMDATGTGLSYRKEGFLALAEPNLRGSATELIGWLPVNIYRKWRHSPRDRHHLQGKRPAETESSTSSREPKWDFLLKVKQN